jgi:hypothetical protein
MRSERGRSVSAAQQHGGVRVKAVARDSPTDPGRLWSTACVRGQPQLPRRTRAEPGRAGERQGPAVPKLFSSKAGKAR